jgi:hypothetical protein
MMITRSVAERNFKKNVANLPPEIIDMILLQAGDENAVYGLGRFWLMKRFMPATLKDVMGLQIEKFESTENGDIQAYIKEVLSRPCNLVDWAAITGRLRYLKYLTEITDSVGTANSMNISALKGYFEIIKYLHYNRSEECGSIGMDLAAMGGKYDVVEFLHNNRTEGCTTFAMNLAAMNGMKIEQKGVLLLLWILPQRMAISKL